MTEHLTGALFYWGGGVFERNSQKLSHLPGSTSVKYGVGEIGGFSGAEGAEKILRGLNRV